MNKIKLGYVDTQVYRTLVKCGMVVFLCISSLMTKAATINIVDDVQTYISLSGDTVNMSGVSELHVTSATAPISGCTINLNSEDSFFFLENIKPSAANSTYLSQVKVNGANAVLNTNVRVVEYAAGAVIIPQSSTFQPLQVFTEDNFQGNSAYLDQYTLYNNSSLGAMAYDMADDISSFILKRGYTATFADNENGTGYSKNYVAQDCDLEIAVLPTKLDNTISFVRVFPWRWTSKKGIAGNIGSNLDIKWWYNWNIDQNSPLDKEYVPIRQHRWWPDLNQNWQTRRASHLLGYNEPDSSSQANITWGDAIWSWGDLLWPGLRLGSPATTDGGRGGWLYPFMDRVIAHDMRVDFVAVHYYWCYNPANPSGAASQMYNYLKAVHDRYGLPIWITEWNNGADWTGCGDPSYAQQAACIGAMVDMLDSTPWVERYAIYNWVEDVRRVEWNDGSLTDAGIVYRDQVSPVGYQQKVSGSGKSTEATYNFDDNFRDSSDNGNNPLVYGAPKRVADLDLHGNGNTLVLDGTDDYLVLPTNIAEDADFTFAAWVNWDGGDIYQRIFDFGNNTTQYMFLTPSSYSNTLRFAITTSGGGSNEQRVETTGLTPGQWVHVAVTLNGNTGTLYVNGSPEATNTSMTINPSDFQPENNYLGKSQWPDPLFNGMLDDVVIADYALTDTQISDLYASGQAGQFVQAPLDIVGVSAGAEETYDIYDMDNGHIHNAAIDSYDRDRNTRWANDGTVANGWIRYDLGAISEIERVKLRFYNGASRTYPIRIEIDGVQVFNGNTSMTSGYWETVFTPTSGRYVTITMTGNNSDGTGWFGMWETQIWGPQNEPPSFNSDLIDDLDNAIELEPYTGQSLAGYATDPDGDPMTFSKDSGPAWLIVSPDGTLSGIPLDSNVGENLFTVRVTDNGGLSNTATMTIQVANTYSGTQGMDDLLGLAAQWLTFDCVLCDGANLDGINGVTISDFSVLTHNWLGDETLQLHLKLDETIGDTAHDSSVYRRDGSLFNGPTWDTGYVGGALAFDGVDDHVEVTGYKGVTGTGSRTCSAWIKTGAVSKEILSWGDNNNGSRWVIRINEGGQLRAEVQGGNIIGTELINDNQWHHIAVVLIDDGSPDIAEVQLYVDGQPEAISGYADEPINTGLLQDVQIGAYSAAGAPRYFQGLIDDVRIYDVALSQQDIQGLGQ